jgi:hypothetical protein
LKLKSNCKYIIITSYAEISQQKTVKK